MLFTFNSYIRLKTIISNIHASYNQNLIEILQNIPATTCGASSSSSKLAVQAMKIKGNNISTPHQFNVLRLL